MLFEVKENQPWESWKPNHVYDHEQQLQQKCIWCFPSFDNGYTTLLHGGDELGF